MISSETNLLHLRRHPPTNTQPFHSDLLAPNRSSLITETDIFFVGPTHRNHQHLSIDPKNNGHCSDRTLDHLTPPPPPSSQVFSCFEMIQDEPSTTPWRIFRNTAKQLDVISCWLTSARQLARHKRRLSCWRHCRASSVLVGRLP